VTEKQLGDVLVDEKLITRAQLDEALRLQGALERYAPLGHVLVAQKLLTRDQLVSVLRRHRRSSRLGELLVKGGDISEGQLEEALAEQRQTGQPLGTILLRLNYITEEQLRLALCRQLHIRFLNLDTIIIESSLKDLVSEKFAFKHRVVPLSRIANSLVVAMDDPTQVGVVDDLQRTTRLSIEVVTSTSAAIMRALERLYHQNAQPGKASKDLDIIGEDPTPGPGIPLDGRPVDSADQLVRKLLRVAIDHGASDIHLETVGRRLQARFRIDGVLQYFNLGDLTEDISRQRPELFSRIKILSNLDIAERRRPQDGSFRAWVQNGGQVAPMDFRVSVIPSYHGENAVIRVLDPRNAPESIDTLGLSEPIVARLKPLLRSSAGMLLVTGPTGSGKSTTLFGILRSIYRPTLKIVTAEDPIEYVCNDFCQHEVDDRIGNTFARYLRSFLRNDPEVIMLGEIRDPETAELAFRAAETGHLILSTLHTSDALGSISRLRGLGVTGDVCSDALLGVLSQRLVRQVCWNCKIEYEPTLTELEAAFSLPPRKMTWYRGAGCVHCHHSGYRGRVSVAELWTPSADDVTLINEGAPAERLEQSAWKSTIPMAADALVKLREGRTSLEELVRILPPSALQKLGMLLA
jgi:type IV pilus assembly protein PilB